MLAEHTFLFYCLLCCIVLLWSVHVRMCSSSFPLCLLSWATHGDHALICLYVRILYTEMAFDVLLFVIILECRYVQWEFPIGKWLVYFYNVCTQIKLMI